MDNFLTILHRLCYEIDKSDNIPLVYARTMDSLLLRTYPRPLLEFLYCQSGTIPISIGGRSEILYKNDLAFINAHLGNYGAITTSDSRYACISFKVDQLCLPEWIIKTPIFHRVTIPSLEIMDLYRKIEDHHNGRVQQKRYRFKTDVLFFISTIIDSFVAAESLLNNTQENTMKSVLEYIYENYTNPEISVKAIASRFQLSPAHLSRSFKKAYNTSPIDMIVMHRIRHAQELLSKSDISIKEISYRSGFNDQLYFSRLFKKVNNISPSHYRTLQLL